MTLSTRNFAFFDRGLPDAIAHAERFGVDTRAFNAAAQTHRYDTRVFVLPPWRDIFVADEFRGNSFDEYAEFHALIVDAYTTHGYQLIDVHLTSVEARAQFVLDEVAS